MGYRIVKNENGSGEFIDNLSGKVYPFTGGKRANESRTAAKQAMIQDQAQMRKAAASRLPAPVPTINGYKVHPNEARVTLPRAEKLASVTHHTKVESVEAIESAADVLIAHHQRSYDAAHNNADRQRALRRIAAAQTAKERAVAGQTRRDVRQAELGDPKLADAIERATQIYSGLLLREGVPAEILAASKNNLNELRHSRNYVAYEESEKALQAAFDLHKAAIISTAEQAANAARREVRGLKSADDQIVPPADSEPTAETGPVAE